MRVVRALAAGLFVFAYTAGSAAVAVVTLEWDANTESGLAGYCLFRSTGSLLGTTTAQALSDPSVLKTSVPPSSLSRTVTDLSDGTTYHFRLTAYDTRGNHSSFNVDAASAAAEVSFCPSAPAVSLPGSTGTALAKETFLSPALADNINDAAVFGPDADEVTVYDLKGTEYFHARAAEGATPVWNCRDAQGRLVPSGVYIARIRKKSGGSVYQKFAVVK